MRRSVQEEYHHAGGDLRQHHQPPFLSCEGLQLCSAIAAGLARAESRCCSFTRARKILDLTTSGVISSAEASSRLVHPSPFCSMNVYFSVGCNASRAFVANSFVKYCRSGSACESLSSSFVSWPSRVRSPAAQVAASSGRRLRNIISASFTAMRISQVENCEFPSNCWILLKAL